MSCRALLGTEQPSLQEGDHTVDSWQEVLALGLRPLNTAVVPVGCQWSWNRSCRHASTVAKRWSMSRSVRGESSFTASDTTSRGRLRQVHIPIEK
jgi:hypothetical protein